MEKNKQIKILSFNILADVLAHTGNFTKLYPSKGWVLDWDYRFPKIVKIIMDYDPDIFCLAECNHYIQFKSEFEKNGYDSVYSQKDSNTPLMVLEKYKKIIHNPEDETEFTKTRREGFFDPRWETVDPNELGHGVAIFYKKDRFMPTKTAVYGCNPVSAHVQLHDSVTDQDLAVTMAHLKSKRPNFLIREKEIVNVCYRIEELVEDIKIKSILCGDLNADSGEKTPFIPINSYGYKSAYGVTVDPDNLNGFGKPAHLLPEWTTYKWRGPPSICGKMENEKLGLDKHTIDYIFVRNAQVINQIAIDPTLTTVNGEDVGIPNENYPSDHFAIGAIIV